MTAVAGRMPPAPGPVRWAVRAYAPLLVLSIVIAMLVVPWVLRAQAQTVYESQALVVARQFTLPLAALPRYGEAVFDNGAVAADVGRRYGLSTAGDSLIPEKLSVVTSQDSVVMTVTARDSDPVLAADIANTAAEAYLDELNRPGPGLAVFVLQSAATPSTEPTSGAPGTPVQLAVGGAAGGLLGLGLIGLLYAIRRPVVDPHDIEAVVGAPVLGVVRFPGRTVRDPNAVPGLAPVARALARSRAHDVYVVSPPDRRAQRAAVARMLVQALARWRPAALQTYDASRGGWVRPDDRDLGYAPSLVITDVAKPLDAGPDSVDSDTLLVVREGTPERRLWDMLADHADSSYLGVVVVRRASWLPVRMRMGTAPGRPAERSEPPAGAEAPAPPRESVSPDAAPSTGSTAEPAAGNEAAAGHGDTAAPTTPTVARMPVGLVPPPVAAPVEQPAALTTAPTPAPADADGPQTANVPAAVDGVSDEPHSDARPVGPRVEGRSDEPASAGDDRAGTGGQSPSQPAAPPSQPAGPPSAPVVHSVPAVPAAPAGPASLPWRDAASLLGLPADDSPDDSGGRPPTAAPGWPDSGRGAAQQRPGAATGWPFSS